MSKILIVEDDIDIAELEKDYLEMNGFDACIISNGEDALNEINTNKYDLIILDLMLPGVSGLDICREIREKIDTPILMISAKGELHDKVRGLGIGANDYITKPFDPTELVARVKSQIASFKRLKGNTDEIIIKNIKIIPSNYKVYKDGVEIKLPTKEFELLSYLASYPNIVFSKEELFERIWDLESIGDDATVTVHINRIRDKIEKNPSKPEIIETVWGAGYRISKQNNFKGLGAFNL